MKKKRIKSRANDFTSASLPKNRRTQFFNILKHNFNLLTSIGLTILLASIPLIVTIFFKSSFVIGLVNNADYLIEDGSALNAQGEALYFQNTLLFSGINTLCYTILFIVIGGILRVSRQIYWGQHVSYWRDFAKGLKNNLVNSLLFGLIFGLSRFIFDIMSVSNFGLVPSILIYGINFALIYPVLIIGMIYTSLYSGSFIKTCYHSFIIYIKKFPYILLPLLFLIAMPLLSLIPIDQFILKIILILVLMFVVMPFYILATYGCELYCIDVVINRVYYPDLENKGLTFDE